MTTMELEAASRLASSFILQWRIQGKGPGGPPPYLFLDQTEALKAEKNIFLRPPHLPCLRVWMTAPAPSSHLSEGLDPSII